MVSVVSSIPTGATLFFAETFIIPLNVMDAVEVFIFNTNLAYLTFLHIEGVLKVSAKNKVAPMGIELTTPKINRLEI